MSSDNFEMLSVGQVKSEWVGMQDGYLMEYNNYSGLTLFIFFQHPTPEEERQFRAEMECRLAFSEYKGVGFFCLKFGDLPWGDCAFSPNLYKVKPVFPILDEGKGYPLNVIFVDGAEGRIKEIRMIGLGNVFSNRFKEWCEESLQREMTRREYNRIVDECYEKHDTEHLMKKALFWYEISPHREEMDKERG